VEGGRTLLLRADQPPSLRQTPLWRKGACRLRGGGLMSHVAPCLAEL
jgi:hypothetical protein